MATLRKVDGHASDSKQLNASAMFKIQEFLKKGYPAGIIRHMCGILAEETKKSEWIQIRKQVPNYKSFY